MAFWDRLTGAVAGIAVARAGATAIEPVLEPLRQDAWKKQTPRVLDVGMLAELVAQGYLSIEEAKQEAARSGFSAGRMEAAAQRALHGAAVAEAITIWRRTAFDNATDSYREGLLNHALAKAAIEPQYWDAIKATRILPMTPADVAVAVQRSLIPNQGQLPFSTDIPRGVVPPMPQTDIDGYGSAAAWGTSHHELDVLTRAVGLPPGMDLVARLVFRGLLHEADFKRAAAESNRRLEWADAEIDGYREIATAADYIGAYLKGWISQDAMHKGVERHGMSHNDADLIYLSRGRPATPRQAIIGYRRGGRVQNVGDSERAYSDRATEESDIRPEWSGIEYHAALGYPSLFQLNRLVQAGAIDAATASTWSFKSGMAQEVTTVLEKYWQQGTGPASHPNVTKAENQTWTALHKSYVNHESDEAKARQGFALIRVDPTVEDRILELWDFERSLTRTTLTKAQIKKAWKEPAINAETGQPWTTDEALAALTDLGMSPTDAQSYLNI